MTIDGSDCSPVKEIIVHYKDVLDRSSQLLLEREKLTREEFEGLFA